MTRIKQLLVNFKSNLKKYPLVNISFLDHTQCTGENPAPGPAEVSGRLIGEDEATYYVAAWIFDTVNDSHTNVFPVVKSKYLKIRRMK